MELLRGLDFYPSETISDLPEDAQYFFNVKEAGVVTEDIERKNDALAAVLLPLSLPDFLSRLLSRGFTVSKNEGDIEGVWAKDICWQPFFDEKGTLYAVVDWKLKALLHLETIVFPLVGKRAAGRELLKDRIYTRKGAVFLELTRAEETKVRSSTGNTIEVDDEIRPKRFQFGDIRFILIPRSDREVLVVLQMGRALFTRYPHNTLQAIVSDLNT